jgi:hypothetical protein
LLVELEVTIASNKSLKQLPVDGRQGEPVQFLRSEAIYSSCL